MKFHDVYKGLAESALSIPMKDEEAREVEKLLDDGEYSPIKHHSVILESFSPSERSDISVITDGSIDAQKEVLLPTGMDFSRFQKNPIVTFGHNWHAPPIGKSLWQKFVGGTTWKAKTQYVSRPDSLDKSQAWLPDNIWHLVKEGFLPGKSIGGLGKVRKVTKDDGDLFGKADTIVEKTLIYEYSVVPIQANKNAIVEAVAKSLVNLPEDFLQKNFPEIYETLKATVVEVTLPRIKTFKTVEQYKEELHTEFARKCEELPNLVDDVLSGVLGQV